MFHKSVKQHTTSIHYTDAHTYIVPYTNVIITNHGQLVYERNAVNFHIMEPQCMITQIICKSEQRKE